MGTGPNNHLRSGAGDRDGVVDNRAVDNPAAAGQEVDNLVAAGQEVEVRDGYPGGAPGADDSRVDDSRADDSRADDSQADDSRADDSQADDSQADDSRVDDSRADDRCQAIGLDHLGVVLGESTDGHPHLAELATGLGGHSVDSVGNRLPRHHRAERWGHPDDPSPESFVVGPESGDRLRVAFRGGLGVALPALLSTADRRADRQLANSDAPSRAFQPVVRPQVDRLMGDYLVGARPTDGQFLVESSVDPRQVVRCWVGRRWVDRRWVDRRWAVPRRGDLHWADRYSDVGRTVAAADWVGSWMANDLGNDSCEPRRLGHRHLGHRHLGHLALGPVIRRRSRFQQATGSNS